MQEIVAHCATVLRGADFKKRRHSFNRHMPSGLVHVVNFWQAPKEPPAWTEIPGFRHRLHGTFRVDFGVWVPEMTRMGTPRSSWINEYDCDLRASMGRLLHRTNRDPQLLTDDAGIWWELDHATIADIALDLITDVGLPWLNTYPDHDAIESAFVSHGAWNIGLNPAGDLDMVQMLEAKGRRAEGRALLEKYVEENQDHSDYLKDYLPEIGHADLVGRLTFPRRNTRR